MKDYSEDIKKMQTIMRKQEKRFSSKVIVVPVILLCICCLSLAVFLLVTKNGKYVSEYYQDMGIDFYLDVHGNALQLCIDNGEGIQTIDGDISFEKDVVTASLDGATVTGSYDSKARIIVLEGIEFKKE